MSTCLCHGGPNCCRLQRIPQVQLPPVIIEKHFYRSFDPPNHLIPADELRERVAGFLLQQFRRANAMRAEDV